MHATNSFFKEGGANEVFGDERIVFQGSTTFDPNKVEKRLDRSTDNFSKTPFQVRYMEAHKKDDDKETNTAILNDLTKEIAILLDGQSTLGGKPLKGSQVAVLCPTGKQGKMVLDSLADHGIPCVLRSQNTVFESHEAEDLVILMEALLEPSQPMRIRKALVLNFFSLDAPNLLELEDDTEAWDFLVSQFFDWRELWQNKGFGVAFQNLLDGDWQREV